MITGLGLAEGLLCVLLAFAKIWRHFVWRNELRRWSGTRQMWENFATCM